LGVPARTQKGGGTPGGTIRTGLSLRPARSPPSKKKKTVFVGRRVRAGQRPFSGFVRRSGQGSFGRSRNSKRARGSPPGPGRAPSPAFRTLAGGDWTKGGEMGGGRGGWGGRGGGGWVGVGVFGTNRAPGGTYTGCGHFPAFFNRAGSFFQGSGGPSRKKTFLSKKHGIRGAREFLAVVLTGGTWTEWGASEILLRGPKSGFCGFVGSLRRGETVQGPARGGGARVQGPGGGRTCFAGGGGFGDLGPGKPPHWGSWGGGFRPPNGPSSLFSSVRQRSIGGLGLGDSGNHRASPLRRFVFWERGGLGFLYLR